MVVQIELPEEILRALSRGGTDVSRHVLEAVAKEGYRSGLLSLGEVAQLLGFESSIEADTYLRSAGVPLSYSVDDFENDMATQRNLGVVP